jgi:hypothetical protein
MVSKNLENEDSPQSAAGMMSSRVPLLKIDRKAHFFEDLILAALTLALGLVTTVLALKRRVRKPLDAE